MSALVIDLDAYRRRRQGQGMTLDAILAKEAANLRETFDRIQRLNAETARKLATEVWVGEEALDFLTRRGWRSEIVIPFAWYPPVREPARRRRGPFLPKNPRKPKPKRKEPDRPPQSGWWALVRILSTPAVAHEEVGP